MLPNAFAFVSFVVCMANGFLKIAVASAALDYVSDQSQHTCVTQGSTYAGRVPILKKELKKIHQNIF